VKGPQRALGDDLRVGQGVEGLEEVRNRVAAKRGVGQHRLPAYLERRAVVAAQKGVQHDPQAHGAGRGALIGDAVLNPRRVGLPGRMPRAMLRTWVTPMSSARQTVWIARPSWMKGPTMVSE